jgi:hypothetical protein
MTKTARRAAGVAVVVAVLGWTSSAAATESSAADASQEAITGTNGPVRGLSRRLVAVITEAAAQSKTFRGLVDRVGNTDGIVFVADGQCGHGVRACLLHTVTIAGPNRLLWILVDPRKTDREAMRSIGHELQHAVEVLDDPSVRSADAIYRLLLRIGGDRDSAGRFETEAATRAGEAVSRELWKSAAAGKRRE